MLNLGRVVVFTIQSGKSYLEMVWLLFEEIIYSTPSFLLSILSYSFPPTLHVPSPFPLSCLPAFLLACKKQAETVELYYRHLGSSYLLRARHCAILPGLHTWMNSWVSHSSGGGERLNICP